MKSELKKQYQEIDIPVHSWGEVTSEGQYFNATIAVVSAYLQHNTCPPDVLPDLICRVYEVLLGKGGSSDRPQSAALHSLIGRATRAPAVPVEQSVQYDHIVCLEDGKHLKSLKGYIRRVYGLSPELYRRKWDLPKDYPMVAPELSERRSAMARNVKPHLGRLSKPGSVEQRV